MLEAVKMVKELIEDGKHFLIVYEPTANDSTLLAVFALKQTIEKAGKEIFLHPWPETSFLEKFGKLISSTKNTNPPQDIKIKIPKNIPVEEIRYEEENDALSIIIASKEKLETSSLTIEKSLYKIDGAFCFSDDEKIIEKSSVPISNIGQNKIIYLTKNKRTLAEKVSGICGALSDEYLSDFKISTLLFSSLMLETDHLRRKADKEAFALASSFLESGADHEIVREISDQEKKINYTQLLGRALARTTLDRPLKTSWTFLAKKDFEKTKTSPSKDMLLPLIQKIRSSIEYCPLSVLFYEENGIETLFWGEEKGLISIAASRLGRELQSPYFFGPSFSGFSEAEKNIRQLLREN